MSSGTVDPVVVVVCHVEASVRSMLDVGGYFDALAAFCFHPSFLNTFSTSVLTGRMLHVAVSQMLPVT